MKKLLGLFVLTALAGCDGDSKPEILDFNYKDEGAKECITRVYEKGETEEFNDITQLTCSSENISSTVDFANLNNLESISFVGDLNYNHEPHFDASHLSQVKELIIQGTNIESLDLSANSKLENLALSHLPKLNTVVTNSLNELKKIDFYQVPIEELDLSMNTNLDQVRVQFHSIKSLGLNNHSNLTYLRIYNGSLETITLDAPNLRDIRIEDNMLKAIDTSLSPSLDFLSLHNNQLTEISVDNNYSLRELIISENPLTSETKEYLDSVHWVKSIVY